MKCIEEIVDNIYKNSNVSFQLSMEGYGSYSTPIFDESQNCFTKNFNFEYTKCCIKVNAAFSAISDLLIFCIKEKLEEAFIHKRTIISELLSGEDINEESKNFFISLRRNFI